jgi:hypothetical protein
MGMIYMQTGSFGKAIAVFNRMKGMEDSTKLVKSDAVIYSGRPVTLYRTPGADLGKIVPVTEEASRVYGLAKFQKNSYVDEVVDDYGFYGSKKGTVIVTGIVEVTHNVFTDPAGVETTVKTYDDAQTYLPMQGLFVELTDVIKIGQITNQAAAANNETFLGFCLAIDTTNKILQILLSKPSEAGL